MASKLLLFLAELKRRKVYRVATVYVVAGAGIIGLCEAALPSNVWEGIQIPVGIVILVGLPIALILAWAYELKPEKSPPAEPAAYEPPPTPVTETPPDVTDKEQRKSIAVLPFANLSGHPEDEYFGDGMTEEIINALCQLGQIRVIARTSSFAFKGQNLDVREIGRALGVGHVLEGSVRRAGDRIRVTAQMIKVSDGFHLWSQRFDRVLEDVFAIQDEVSLAITDHLQVHLVGTDRARLTKRHTDDIYAYDSYLLGRHLLERFDEVSLLQAIEHLERAIAEDPGYAEALAALSHAHFLLGFYSLRVPQEAFEESKRFALEALALDGDLAEARSALGLVKAYLDWDWRGSLAEFDQALLRNPNSAQAHRWYTYVLIGVEDLQRAVEVAFHALELNPLSPESVGMLTWCLLRADEHDEARKYLRRWLELKARPELAYWFMGQIDLKESRFPEGISRIEKADRLAPEDPLIVSALGWAYAVGGRPREAQEMMESLDALSENRYVDRYLYAKIFAGLGDADAAFEHLEEAVARREMGVATILGDETLESLHSDPRFARLLDRIGLGELTIPSDGAEE
jgi:adenylate cyclase